MLAVPDYKELYLELFRASEQAARLLHDAQQRAEEQVMEDDSCPVFLCPKQQGPDVLRAEGDLNKPARHAKGSPFGRAGTEGD